MGGGEEMEIFNKLKKGLTVMDVSYYQEYDRLD